MGRVTRHCVIGEDVSVGPRSVVHAASLLRSGKVTCRGLTEHALAKAELADTRLNAFITITADSALSAAAMLDEELRNGRDRGPLHGIPVVHKDIFDTASVRTTMGSRFFKDRIPSQDAAVVMALKTAGAVSLGKTNMSECASGLSGLHSFYGSVRNGYDDMRLAGGSSSGTAAAISSGVCLVGTGSDSGGSIRAPAAYNGIVGLRPTKGLVNLKGAFARSQTLDVAGPMGHSVADVAALLSGMSQRPHFDYLSALEKEAEAVRIGVISDWSDDTEDPHVRRCLSETLQTMRDTGIDVVEVPFDMRLDQVLSAALSILCYEFATNIRGVRGFEKEAFGPGVQQDLQNSEHISTEEYRKALEFRESFTADLKSVFEQVDFIAGPSVPATAPRVGADVESFECGRRSLLPASLAGLPAISVPCATGDLGLPVGLQLIGNCFSETRMLQVAAAIERECVRP